MRINVNKLTFLEIFLFIIFITIYQYDKAGKAESRIKFYIMDDSTLSEMALFMNFLGE